MIILSFKDIIISWSFLLIYSYSLLSIISAKNSNLEIISQVYIYSLLPTMFSLSYTLYKYFFGVLLLLFTFTVKLLIIILCNENKYIYPIVDGLLQIIFIVATFSKVKHVNIKRKVIPIKTKIYEVCSICLESMDSKLVETECKHVFHEICLSKWNKVNVKCPLCRHNL